MFNKSYSLSLSLSLSYCKLNSKVYKKTLEMFSKYVHKLNTKSQLSTPI